jgi:hypothetical protein
MDETQISITIKPMYIERLIYWIIIIVLAVLLVMAYLKDDSQSSTKTTDTTKTTTTDTAAPTPAPSVDTTPPAATNTCHDAKKDGDETDVDCGGSCEVKCAANATCAANSDCISGTTCVSGHCGVAAAPAAALSGKLELDVVKATYEKQTSGAVKVTGVTFTVKNGLADDLANAQIKIFLKSKSNTGCLNQGKSGECDVEFARFVLPTIASGKSLTQTHTFAKDEYTSGTYVQKDDTYYDYEDTARSSFNVVGYLYDQNGDLIDGKTISDGVLVSP